MIYLTFYLIDLCIAAPGEVQTPTLERGLLWELGMCVVCVGSMCGLWQDYVRFLAVFFMVCVGNSVEYYRYQTGSLKPDITVAELEDGTVPHAIVKCILFLQQHRHLPTLYKGMSHP